MFKKTLFTAVLLTIFCINSIGQTSNHVEKAEYYMETGLMPDPLRFLPDYPKVGSIPFLNDSLRYEEGKQLRETPRGKVAVEDVSRSVPHVLDRFGKSIGIDLDADKMPKTAALIYQTMATARLSISNAKNVYSRQRPYQHFNEGTPVPERESKDDFTSYPSGHTIRFWIAALTMTAIAPEYQNEFLRTGYDMGQSRVIVGFHYQSDVDNARLVAGACFARLCAEDSWIAALREASEEFHEICPEKTE